MAEKPLPEHIRDLLECGICLEEFTDPRSLPCLHSFCLGCLTSHVSSAETFDDTFRCPECQILYAAPGGDVKNFPTNFLMNKLKDILPAHDVGKGAPFGLRNDERPNCDRHWGPKINFYCNTCALAVCPECIHEEHQGHDTENLSSAVHVLKRDLDDVSMMGEKRIATLQNMRAELKKTWQKMEKEFKKAARDITFAAENLRSFISHHEYVLQNKLEQAKETQKRQVISANEEIDKAIANTSRLVLSTRFSPEDDAALCTILKAPSIKKQFLQQQDTPIPTSDYNVTKTYIDSADLIPTANRVGDIESLTTFEGTRTFVKAESCVLRAPTHTIRVDYTGTRAVCGIAHLHQAMICVAQSGEPYIWVYSITGRLTRKFQVPGVAKIIGLTSVGNKQDELVIAGGSGGNVLNFVKLSENIEVVQSIPLELPTDVNRVSSGQSNQLIAYHTGQNNILTISPAGQILSNVQVAIPHQKTFIICITQTKSGFVICDKENRQVYFTDAMGQILRTSTDCLKPFNVVHTSWGHVLIADYAGCDIKAFSENDNFLGSVHDTGGPFPNPKLIHVDEARGSLCIACGPVRNTEVRVYRFTPGDLPSLPLQLSVNELSVNVKLAKV